MPLYRRVSGQLREQCLAAGGEMLPSLRQLSQDLEVNHATVSRALRDLEREGLVEIVPRKGIFSVVRPPQADNIEFVVLVNDKANLVDVSMRMARGIEGECQNWQTKYGAATMTRSLLAQSALPDAQSWLEAARARATVGVVFLGHGYLDGEAGLSEDEFIAGVARKMPVVLAGSPHRALDLDCVYRRSQRADARVSGALLPAGRAQFRVSGRLWAITRCNRSGARRSPRFWSSAI